LGLDFGLEVIAFTMVNAIRLQLHAKESRGVGAHPNSPEYPTSSGPLSSGAKVYV